jgi:hypothetical protein
MRKQCYEVLDSLCMKDLEVSVPVLCIVVALFGLYFFSPLFHPFSSAAG